MSQSLQGCRHVPGWVKPFLAAIKDGYNEKNAAGMAGVGTLMVRQRAEKDPTFKKDYDDTHNTRRARPGHGAW
jgi:hypothetical protein